MSVKYGRTLRIFIHLIDFMHSSFCYQAGSLYSFVMSQLFNLRPELLLDFVNSCDLEIDYVHFLLRTPCPASRITRLPTHALHYVLLFPCELVGCISLDL